MAKHSYEFKKKIVLEYLSSNEGCTSISRKYGMDAISLINKTIYPFYFYSFWAGKLFDNANFITQIAPLMNSGKTILSRIMFHPVSDAA